MNATPDITTVVAQVNIFLASARERARDGLTWAEFGQLFVELLHLVVAELDLVNNMTGPQKKEVVMTAAAALFDTFADKCVPLAARPAWILVRPATRTLLIALASGGTEALLNITRNNA